MTGQPETLHPRLERERRTVDAMISLYCRDHHSATKDLCPDCAALSAYAFGRLERCVYGADKPTCANCPIHCYRPEMRARIREVMRYSGKRLILQGRLDLLRHYLL